MTKQNIRRSYEFSLRTLDILLVIVALLASVALIFITHQIDVSYGEMQQATKDYISWQNSAADLTLGADYLTEQARSFAITANARHLNKYFEEAFTTRRRGKAVAAMRTELLEGTEAYEALQASLRQSTELMVTELYSMRLVIDAQGYNIKNYPEELQRVNVKWLDSLLTQDGKMERAQEILFDDTYQEQRDSIAANTKICIDALVQKTAERQQSAISETHRLLIIQRVLVCVLLLLVLTAALVTAGLVIRPLYMGIAKINSSNPLDVRGAREIRFLARAYNLMFDANQQRTEQLAYDATHDVLTGVYNRNGYEAICRRIDFSTTALLLLDIDHFKDFNDTYGHDTGDRILRRVTSVLALNFRSNDYICRIGGDEFVVMMENTTSRHKALISRKVQQINDSLKATIGDLPPVTVSVGVAFGDSSMIADDVFKAADEALYEVKKNGRCGISFAI